MSTKNKVALVTGAAGDWEKIWRLLLPKKGLT